MSELPTTHWFPDANDFPPDLMTAILLKEFHRLQLLLTSMGSEKEEGQSLTWSERFVLSVVKMCQDQEASQPLNPERFQFMKIAVATAMDYGMEESFESLLDYGFPVNETVANFSSALSFAIQKINPAMVELLLERGANPNIEIFPNWFEAIKPYRCRLLPLLFEHGANINLQDPTDQQSALHRWVAEFDVATDHSEESQWVLEILVRQGIDTQIKDNKGLTAQDYFKFLDNEQAGIMIPQEVARQQAQILCKSTTLPRQNGPKAPRL